MAVQSPDGEHASGLTDLLAIGFGTTVAMWAVGYVGHMPLIDVPPLFFVGFMLLCLVVGGWIVGRMTPRGLRGGLALGLIVGLLNLLILGSVLAKPNDGQVVPRWSLPQSGSDIVSSASDILTHLIMPLWLPGYFASFLVLASAGSIAGTAFRANSPLTSGAGQGVRTATDWLLGFAWTACLATLLLISVGGLVTGFRAGMAVPDWPNTFGYNMFFYPLAKMTGGVFYEHAHRLLGALVGLTTLTYAVLVTIHRRSRGALILVWIVGFGILLQGIMGGIRVTDNSAQLAVIHGFFAHAILAGMVGVAVLLSPPYLSCSVAMPFIMAEHDEYGLPNETDAFLAMLLVPAILGQTLLGTLVRQMDMGLILHISVAMLVAVLAIVVGVRLWGRCPQIAVLGRGGVALMCLVVLQLLLGGTALVNRTPPASASPSAAELLAQADALRPATHAILTTAHQTTAAVLLGTATFLAFWTCRLRANHAAKKEEIVAEAEAVRVAL